MKTKVIDGMIALCALGFFITSYLNEIGTRQIWFCAISGVFFLIFFLKLFQNNREIKSIAQKPAVDTVIAQSSTLITELVLQNDEEQSIATWEMYGKVSLVIGLDIGENKVDVNLLRSTYASTIDVEHAVLNFSSGKWYLEDLGSENGVSVIKSDGKKYKLTAMKPCLVEKGDIIFISLTKLKLS